MFRHKDKMLKGRREIKNKNKNKDHGRDMVKNPYCYELKGNQQALIKEGIKVHMNELRHVRHISYSDLNESDKDDLIGNTTIGNLLQTLNKNEYTPYNFERFGDEKRIVAKTHDMTRWQDKKKKTLDKKYRREEKIQSQL